jgi:hypothetical protein
MDDHRWIMEGSSGRLMPVHQPSGIAQIDRFAVNRPDIIRPYERRLETGAPLPLAFGEPNELRR